MSFVPIKTDDQLDLEGFTNYPFGTRKGQVT